MTPADRIAQARTTLRLQPHEVASAIGLNPAWYADLESYEDELEMTLTLRQGIRLAEVLGVKLGWLLFGSSSEGERVAPECIPGLVADKLKNSGQSKESFEEQIGWEFGDWSNPTNSHLDSPLVFLRDLAQGLGLPYESLLP